MLKMYMVELLDDDDGGNDHADDHDDSTLDYDVSEVLLNLPEVLEKNLTILR